MSDILAGKRKISVDELPRELPHFDTSGEPKETAVKRWLVNWIISSVKNNKIKENDILPSKNDISDYLGVSTGTVQNAVRYIEDEGLLKSKQKCGTMIANVTNPVKESIKATSKRDKAVIAVKRIIIRSSLMPGDCVPSTRKTSEFINVSQNTVRQAYEILKASGIIEFKKIPGNESDWVLLKRPYLSKNELFISDDLFPETLVDKITKSMKFFLAEKFKIGDKIPSHEEFARHLDVSVKTVHDCIKKLNKEGIVISRRGKYGSILAQDPLNPVFEPLKENSIFAKASDSAFYSYQKIESKLVALINQNYNAGDKLPSMKELSIMFDVSTNTIRKALIAISQDGYITFGRGRYGGTFVIEKPKNEDNEPYKWLSVNPEFV